MAATKNARPKKRLDNLQDALTELKGPAVRLPSDGVRPTTKPTKDASPEEDGDLLWWETPPPHYLTRLAALNLDNPDAVLSACREFVYPERGEGFLVIYMGGPPTDDELPVVEFQYVAQFVQGVLHNLHEHGGLTWDQIDRLNWHLEQAIPRLQASPNLPSGVQGMPLDEALAEARKRGDIVPVGRISEGVRFEAATPQIEEFTLGIVCSLRDLLREEAEGKKRVNRCESCGRLFILSRSHQRYCSDRCLSRAANRRFRAKNSKAKVLQEEKPSPAQ